jgi:hypothetical protein
LQPSAEEAEPITVSHRHSFGRALGSACSIEGCGDTRTRAFKKRSKRP